MGFSPGSCNKETRATLVLQKKDTKQKSARGEAYANAMFSRRESESYCCACLLSGNRSAPEESVLEEIAKVDTGGVERHA